MEDEEAVCPETVISATYSNLMLLTRDDFWGILQDFPDVARELRSHLKAKLRGATGCDLTYSYNVSGDLSAPFEGGFGAGELGEDA